MEGRWKELGGFYLLDLGNDEFGVVFGDLGNFGELIGYYFVVNLGKYFEYYYYSVNFDNWLPQ